jgi:hypothetical protein
MTEGFIVRARHKDRPGTSAVWVAATATSDEATHAVQEKLGREWNVEITDNRVSAENVASLGLAPGEVVQIGS